MPDPMSATTANAEPLSLKVVIDLGPAIKAAIADEMKRQADALLSDAEAGNKWVGINQACRETRATRAQIHAACASNELAFRHADARHSATEKRGRKRTSRTAKKIFRLKDLWLWRDRGRVAAKQNS